MHTRPPSSARGRWLLLLAVLVALPAVVHASAPPFQSVPGALPRNLPAGLSADGGAALRRDFGQVEAELARLRERKGGALDQLPDAELFLKGALWALRYEERLAPADLTQVRRALERGRERTEALAAGRSPWATRKGRVVRAYRSAVDGSVQPYGLIIPEGYNARKPMRLDVVLHGSTRPVGMSELRFIQPFDDGDTGGRPAPSQDWIELHPLGRVENCYRWAGETDVFEATEDVCRDYAIDRDRIVLRGMSMGASGTWHLGLKHPDRFVALGPYCGYVDTHQFSLTPMPNFVKVGPLPPHQEKALHMLDSIDYAANAGAVPVVAAMGEKDPFFQAHVLMGAAMEREGLRLLNLTSPGTGHVQDPVTHQEQLLRIGQHAARGIDRKPTSLRFVTWTLKYSRSHWLQVLGMREHYARAEIQARIEADGSVRVEEPVNVTWFAIHAPAIPKIGKKLLVGDREVRLGRGVEGGASGPLVIENRNGRWVSRVRPELRTLSGKRPGLQGPIDDAFTRPFLCVRGSGEPWHPAVGAWARAALWRFEDEWRRYFRGELLVKDDTEVTEEDVRRYNLILFGDPGSNRWIRKVLPSLPLRWSRDELRMGGERYPPEDHAPVLIQPNPLPGGKGRYLVLNSGHTFHAQELSTLNYLLFPRLGDWAVMRVDPQTQPMFFPDVGETRKAGYFNEQWK